MFVWYTFTPSPLCAPKNSNDGAVCLYMTLFYHLGDRRVIIVKNITSRCNVAVARKRVQVTFNYLLDYWLLHDSTVCLKTLIFPFEFIILNNKIISLPRLTMPLQVISYTNFRPNKIPQWITFQTFRVLLWNITRAGNIIGWSAIRKNDFSCVLREESVLWVMTTTAWLKTVDGVCVFVDRWNVKNVQLSFITNG